MSLAMTRAEREAFLADLHVAVLSVADVYGRAPLTTPVWYTYEPGGLVTFIVEREGRKAELLRTTGQASVCVQTEEPPFYKYVTIEGPVVATESPPNPDERRAIAHRYIGEEIGDAYIASTEDTASGMMTVRIQPQRWLTTDFAKQYAAE